MIKEDKSKIILVLWAISVIVIIILVMGLANATYFIGNFKQGDNIVIVQSCSNGTALCNNCTVSSITAPNSKIIISDVLMNISISYFNYTFNSSILNASGEYVVDGYCYAGSTRDIFHGVFSLTPNGQITNTVQISVYILFLLVILVIAGLSVRLAKNNTMDKDPINFQEMYEEHKKSEFKFYLKLIKRKMWILGVFGIYLSILLFTAVLNQIVYDLSLESLNSMLNNVMIVMLWLLIPFILFWIGYIIIFFYKSFESTIKYQFGVGAVKR